MKTFLVPLPHTLGAQLLTIPKDPGRIFPLLFEIALLCVMHPTYFRVQCDSGEGNTFLNQSEPLKSILGSLRSAMHSRSAL